MNEAELQALAALTGGKIWKGQLLLPRKESSASGMCNVCALKHERYKECVAFIHGRGSPLATGCSSTATTWHVFQPPKE